MNFVKVCEDVEVCENCKEVLKCGSVQYISACNVKDVRA